MGTVYTGVNMAALRQARADRALDERVRLTMGLRIVGFLYSPDDWRASPKGLFVACDGVEYVQHGPGVYRRRFPTLPFETGG